MANELSSLTLQEISLVDRPSNAEGGIPRARVALFKRDSSVPAEDQDVDKNDPVCKAVFGIVDKDGKTYSGTTYPKSDFAYAPDDVPSHWKLRLTKTPGGAPDAGIVGAAAAALGKGFRGKKVQIPQAALAAVKAKVKAAWKKANAGKDDSEMPDVLKGEKMPLTLQDVEKRLGDQDQLLEFLKAENDSLKAENDLVCKMTKKERKLYATMPAEKRKEFMAADDDKRKAMMDACAQQKKQKAAEDSLDEATKSEYLAAGPNRRSQILANAEARIAKAKGNAPKDDKDDEDEEDPKGGNDKDNEEDDDNVDMRSKKSKAKGDVSTAKMATLEDRILKQEAELTALKKQDRIDHFTKLAETELPNTSGSPVQKGTTLMQMADSLGGENSEAFKSVFKTMKDADGVIAKSFKEVGGTGVVAKSEEVFMSKVDEIQKSEKLDKPHAIEKVMLEHPELFLAYEKDQRRAISTY